VNTPEHFDAGSDAQRRARIVGEMGLGPLWQLRTQDGGAAALDAAATAAPAQNLDPYSLPTPQPMPERERLEVGKQGASQATVMESAWETELSTPGAMQATGLPDPGADRVAAIATMNWNALQDSVSSCRACGLCAGRSNTVFGVGDRKAKWLFIGEGPGYNEDKQGQPFVGPAGQLLDNMMRALDMERGENTYIANIVKCRPTDDQGKDRPPAMAEIAACLPYLQRQIDLIQPEVIVALGKTAAVSLLGLDADTPVAQLRGKLHRYASVPVVVTYHPAYLLRKPADKSKAWFDLCMAAKAATGKDRA